MPRWRQGAWYAESALKNVGRKVAWFQARLDFLYTPSLGKLDLVSIIMNGDRHTDRITTLSLVTLVSVCALERHHRIRGACKYSGERHTSPSSKRRRICPCGGDARCLSYAHATRRDGWTTTRKRGEAPTGTSESPDGLSQSATGGVGAAILTRIPCARSPRISTRRAISMRAERRISRRVADGKRKKSLVSVVWLLHVGKFAGGSGGSGT